MGLLALGILVILFFNVEAKNYAIVLNASQYFKNIRHVTNVHIFYKILKEHGFTDDEIIVYTSDDLVHDSRNIKRGQVILPDGSFAAAKLEESVFTPLVVYNTIMGNHKKLVDMDEKSNILIYMCGHGNSNFLKVHNKHFITSTELTNSLCTLSKRGINKALVILDTCKAETLVEKSRLPDNVTVLFTSTESQSSVSSYNSSLIGQMIVDNFPFFFNIHIKCGLNVEIRMFIKELMDKYDVESDLVLWPDNSWELSEFFDQTHDETTLCKFAI